MSALVLESRQRRDRFGLKGPRAAQWLIANGIAPPTEPNTWTLCGETPGGDALLVARLGAMEFFLEDGAAGMKLKNLAPDLDENPPGVYPVLREDFALSLGGERVHDVLAQICNVNFSALSLEARPLIMTLMIGVSVLVVPQGAATERQYRIWCDPTFGPYLGDSLGAVVIECGGRYTGACG